MNKVYILLFNYRAHGFKAMAAWSYKPTVNDILNLTAFKGRDKLDTEIASRITNDRICRIIFGPNLDQWCEYNLIEHKNGDLNLDDYLLTGYGDMSDKLCIHSSDFKD